jgi:hypothetical protein
MGNPKRLSFLFLLVLTVALPACGSASAPPPTEQEAQEAVSAAVPISACSLLSEAEVAGILGEAILETKDTASGNTLSNCTWLTTSFHSLGILVRAGSSGSESQTIFEQALNSSKSISGADPENIEMMGERAYWAGGTLNQLNVLKGNYWIIVSVMHSDRSMSSTVARQAAQLLIDRIP